MFSSRLYRWNSRARPASPARAGRQLLHRLFINSDMPVPIGTHKPSLPEPDPLSPLQFHVQASLPISPTLRRQIREPAPSINHAQRRSDARWKLGHAVAGAPYQHRTNHQPKHHHNSDRKHERRACYSPEKRHAAVGDLATELSAFAPT